MQIDKAGSGHESGKQDLRLMLLLVVLGLVGLLVWTGLFFGVEWLLSTIWSAASAG